MKKGHAKSESLRTQVYGKLRQGLRFGAVGKQVVATERELAAELGVSRTPIREALALLVHDGLIVPTAKGFTLPDVTNDDVSNIYEVRRLLEPFALKHTVDHLSLADLKALRKSVDEHVAAHDADDVERFGSANSAFRVAWTSRIQNDRLRGLLEHYEDHIVALRELTLSDPGTQEIVIKGLQQILKFLERAEGERAAAAMEKHLMAAEIALKTALKKTSA